MGSQNWGSNPLMSDHFHNIFYSHHVMADSDDEWKFSVKFFVRLPNDNDGLFCSLHDILFPSKHATSSHLRLRLSLRLGLSLSLRLRVRLSHSLNYCTIGRYLYIRSHAL